MAKASKRTPMQPPGTPMGLHDEKRKLDREHPELFKPCACGRPSCTPDRTVAKVVKSKVGK